MDWSCRMTAPETPAASVPTVPTGAAGLDPWELTPEQQAELDAKTARHAAERAAIPDEPPF